ncbi:hypothetical protein IEQ34_005229 [Dendrobium chrysotoxum]|uniref:Uncharacterized protein n=1 Tax=Dendrobium chrysotoxum TaxID=161865 RepID=A0AAV7H947_DENCH|nr:hypothetical protein IEQ34_005229 [Dendrobium chrysotoxum]
MAFLVVRQFITTVQCMFTMIEELVSMHMVKYTTSLSTESIVDIDSEAIERLEALYPTLKELTLTGSPGSHHQPSLSKVQRIQVPTTSLHCWNYEENRFSSPAFIAKILRNTDRGEIEQKGYSSVQHPESTEQKQEKLSAGPPLACIWKELRVQGQARVQDKHSLRSDKRDQRPCVHLYGVDRTRVFGWSWTTDLHWAEGWLDRTGGDLRAKS